MRIAAIPDVWRRTKSVYVRFAVPMLYLPLLFTADYLDVQSCFPLADSASLPVRVLGIVLWDAVLVCVVLVLLALTV